MVYPPVGALLRASADRSIFFMDGPFTVGVRVVPSEDFPLLVIEYTQGYIAGNERYDVCRALGCTGRVLWIEAEAVSRLVRIA